MLHLAVEFTSERKPFSSGNVLSWVDEVCEKVLFPVPQPTSATVATLFKGEGNLLDDGFCVFAFGFAQNDRGGKYTAKSESSGNRETNLTERPNIPTKKGSGAMCIGF